MSPIRGMEKTTADLDNGTYVKALAEYSPRPIHDDAENARATAMLEKIDALETPTPEQIAVAEVLMTLIEAYESKYAMERASGVELLHELLRHALARSVSARSRDLAQ